jgi:nucleoid DNA-binding protein
MNKADLVAEVAKSLETKAQAKAAIDSMINNIAGAMKRKEDITITGFGTFKAVQRKERKGRNPYTGEPIKIKAATRVKFVPGKALKEAVE